MTAYEVKILSYFKTTVASPYEVLNIFDTRVKAKAIIKYKYRV